MNLTSKTINTLESFKLLKENWDGYGADPIPNLVIQNAINIITNITTTHKNPEVFPATAQHIFLQWRTAISYYQLTVSKYHINIYTRKFDKCVIEGSVKLADYDAINSILAEFEKDRKHEEIVKKASDHIMKKNKEAYTKLQDM